jgi:hypothetical protein
MNIQDMVMIGAILLACGLVLWLSAFMGGQVLEKLKTVPVVANNTQAMQVITSSEGPFTKFDLIFMGFFIGFTLFLWISAYFIGGNPVFTWIYIILIALVLLITPALANVWMQWTQNPATISEITVFPLTNTILSSLPLYTFIIEIVGLVILFAKGRGETSGYV